ncbi:MAG TPA: ABC transporter permease, partial [Devosia sp.]|nr:ABC transporter permease [Devosia sp.]
MAIQKADLTLGKAGNSLADPEQDAATWQVRLSRLRQHMLVQALLKVVLVTWVASTLTFVVMHVTPGTYADILMDEISQFGITEERRAEIIAAYGFDRPLWEQYLKYVGNVFRGDLGMSYAQGQSVVSVIMGQLAPTLQLSLASIGFAIIVAVVVSVLTVRSGRVGRAISSVFEVASISMPNFWLGILLISAFSFGWRIFPAVGAGGLMTLVLPTLTLGIPMAGVFIQVLRPELERETNAPYFVSARARGRSYYSVLCRHAMTHAMLPLLILSGTYFATLISGTVVVEALFGRPGIGRIT